MHCLERFPTPKANIKINDLKILLYIWRYEIHVDYENSLYIIAKAEQYIFHNFEFPLYDAKID